MRRRPTRRWQASSNAIPAPTCSCRASSWPRFATACASYRKDGRRRDELERDFGIFLEAGFAARVLADADCALGYATARVVREQAGRPVPAVDALIGGMALAHGATLATRSVTDFDRYGLSIVDPWQHR